MDSNLSQQMRPILHTACLLGDEENIRRLISNGVDINELDFAGCTCTQLAAAAGYLNIVKILIENGASIENQDFSHGNTCLHEVSWRGYSELVKVLSNSMTANIQNKGGFSPLHLACQAGHNQSTRELLLASSNPNLVNTYGDSCLHTAVRYGHAGVTRILLSARTLTDIQNKNGDTALHISSAMGRKKLTKILLSAGSSPTIQNNQDETALDISLRKGFSDVTHVIKNPPSVLTPMQRDQMRASTYKLSGQEIVVPGHSKESNSKGITKPELAVINESRLSETPKRSSKRSNQSSNTGSKTKSVSSSNLKDDQRQGTGSTTKTTTTVSNSSNTAKEEVPKWSPYGCHNQPSMGTFPPPNIDSLPSEPLTTGELYYLDLAGNIHKGPMGVSEGCYCGPLLSKSQNSQSLVALDRTSLHQPQDKNRKSNKDKDKDHQNLLAQVLEPHLSRPPRETTSIYEDQLKTLTHQLSKIHLDTQAQLSSLHSMLNERLKDTTEHLTQSYDETKLKDWVKQYRRFRKELTNNPKTLQQANELLASASTLLSTRLASPTLLDSETDSGI